MLEKRMEKLSFPKRTISTSFTNKRNAAVNFSDMQSDIVINVDGVTFSLHQFPLVSRCGKIKRLVEELSKTDAIANPLLEFSDFPGGPDIFELAAKFCYSINFDITVANAAQLRCAAEFLEMTDDYGAENLHCRTEAFLNEVVLSSIEKSTAVLLTCTPILQHAEEAKVVNRCIDAIASKVCSEDTVKEHIISALATISGHTSKQFRNRDPKPHHDFTNTVHLTNLNPNPNFPLSKHQNANPSSKLNPAISHFSPVDCTAVIEWWADEICELRIDLFIRLVSAMKSHGIRNESLGGALIHYAHKTIKNLHKNPPNYDSKSKVKLTIGRLPSLITSKAMEHEQRILLESIVSMLPQEKYIFSTNFLLSLLRSAILLDTTVACRLDLERRVGAQLENASVDDLLIPASVPHLDGQAGEECGQYDVDVIQRVVATYLQQNQEEEEGMPLDSTSMCDSENGFGLLDGPHQGIVKVGKLMDLYLAEIAPDPHLKPSRFITLAELLPDYARVVDDGLYRAIDIFLKAHRTFSDLERRKICKLLDCQKLSKEACAHAAQNERLPVQLVVQVLYFEQLRMRTAMSVEPAGSHTRDHQFPPLSGALSHERRLPSVPSRIDPYSSLRRDNRELKLEVAHLRLRANELEKENRALKEELLSRPTNSQSSGSGGGFFALMSRRLGTKMGIFSSSSHKSPRDGAGDSSSKQPSDFKFARRRRHSVS